MRELHAIAFCLTSMFPKMTRTNYAGVVVYAIPLTF
jgi:hypothetical protein